MFSRAKNLLSLNLLSLAYFRMILGMSIVYDIIYRWPTLKAHFSSEGVMPAREIMDLLPLWMNPSIFFLSDSQYFSLFLFILNIIFAVSLAIGYRTRLSTFLCWFMAINLYNRNPYVTYGYDHLLMVVLFLSLFLPLGESFSLDNGFKKNKKNISSYGTIAFVLQIIVIYFSAFLFKINDSLWVSGDALHRVMLTEPSWIRHFVVGKEGVTSFFNYMTLLCQVSILFIFHSNKRYRWIPIISNIFLHLGMFASMYLGAFPLLTISLMIILMPLGDKEVEHRESSKYVHYGLSFFLLLVMVKFFRLTYSNVSPIEITLQYLRLNQRWNYFVPSYKNYNWYVLVGVDDNNRKYNLVTNEEEKKFERYNVDAWAYLRWNFTMAVLDKKKLFRGHMGRFLCDETKEFNFQKVAIYNVKERFEEPLNKKLRIILEYPCR